MLLLSLLLSTLTIGATTAQSCNPPDVTWNSIDIFFSLQVQNASYPSIDLQHLTLTPNGGTDQHIYLTPTPSLATNTFQLQGSTLINSTSLHAVVSGQNDAGDGSRNIFFTERTQQLAALDARFGCSPVVDGEMQVEFVLVDGAGLCVRPASGNRWELRYKPVGVAAPLCVDVTLASDPPLPL
ncbi:uncharacterized protein LAJ45_11124 [Morchella importuna]|uniref:uncharacterized protein n=1 Tax=Morchella importuna TaxID=1174673 RepID=UPI001E8E1795|nr:uncharacterized protein LAJ45_11124 [Morchella importuna]KAH8144854.1 hypothetical protein LAJ45_11124 [Morchella importuna]